MTARAELRHYAREGTVTAELITLEAPANGWTADDLGELPGALVTPRHYRPAAG